MATCSTRSSCRVLPDHRVAAAIEHGQDNDSSFIRSEVDTCRVMRSTTWNRLPQTTRRCIRNGPVQRRVVGHDMAEQSGRGARKRVRRHCPILACWRSAPRYSAEAGGAVAVKACACCLTPAAIASMTRSGKLDGNRARTTATCASADSTRFLMRPHRPGIPVRRASSCQCRG